MDELIGALLGDGRYRIEEKLGSGGQGAVYKGTHLTLQVPVAIKVLPSTMTGNEVVRTRFMREAQRSATLRHANIVTTLDYAYDEKLAIFYIVSEFIAGGDLKKLMREREQPMSPQEALGYLRQMAAALQFAHDRNIIHRDIKPGNILIEQPGERVVLCDFGLARMIHGEDLEVTVEGLGMPGTPAYMSPEQCLDLELDHRSDLYSLAIVLYEMVTGRNPFRGENDTSASIRYKQVHESPLPAREANPNLNAAVEAVLMKALAKDREFRFPSANGLLAAYEAACRGVAVEDDVTQMVDDGEPAITAGLSATAGGQAITAGLSATVGGGAMAAGPATTVAAQRPAAAGGYAPPVPQYTAAPPLVDTVTQVPVQVVTVEELLRRKRKRRFPVAVVVIALLAIASLGVYLDIPAGSRLKAENLANQVWQDVTTLLDSSGYLKENWGILPDQTPTATRP